MCGKTHVTLLTAFLLARLLVAPATIGLDTALKPHMVEPVLRLGGVYRGWVPEYATLKVLTTFMATAVSVLSKIRNN